MNTLKNYALILASGSGTRYGADIPKQFVKINGKTIFEHTVDVFENSKEIDNIIIIINPNYKIKADEIIKQNNYKKIIKILNGGKTRKESSYIGVNSIDEKEANVIIHDCVRPFITIKLISDCISLLNKYNAVVTSIPSSDTILEVNENNIVKTIPERNKMRCAQTPQCFKLSIIKKAHELSKNNLNFTDDCGLILKYNLCDIYTINGSTENIKITYQNDIYQAEMIFRNRTKS